MKECGQFCNSEQAYTIREMGFDLPCIGFFNIDLDIKPLINFPYITDSIDGAPLRSQVFDFFRKKFKLSSHADLESVSHLGETYYYKIVNFADYIGEDTTFVQGGFKTLEEAESACIDKLINFCS